MYVTYSPVGYGCEDPLTCRNTLVSARVLRRCIWTKAPDQVSEALRKICGIERDLQTKAALVHIERDRQFQSEQSALSHYHHNQSNQAKRKAFLSSLASFDARHQHERLLRCRWPETCTWLMEEDAFKGWLNEPSPSCFTCYGIPGSGKSVLAAAMANYLRSWIQRNDAVTPSAQESMLPLGYNQNKSICYHFFHSSNHRTLQLSSAFNSMTKQLLENAEIPKEIEDMIEMKIGSATGHTDSEAMELFLKVSKIKEPVLVVLDGLDELNHPGQALMIHTLKRLLEQVNFKINLSCRREEINFRKAFNGCYGVDIFDHKVSRDLTMFIRGAVHASTRSDIETEKLVIEDPNLENEIIDTLIEKADDMYVLVHTRSST